MTNSTTDYLIVTVNRRKSGPGGGGTCENFDRDARVISLGLKFTKMSFIWVSLSWHHFFGVEKIAVIFLGSLKI